MGNMITVTRKKRNYNTHLLKQGVVRVGFFPESRYDGGKSVAEVARYNEFGLGVPRRSFMRPAVFEKKTDLVNLLHRQYRQPPNAPSTIKKKGFNAPLRDTHLMLNSVRYQAEERAKK